MDTAQKATGEQPDYLSYLLRLWRVSDDEEPAWRALLKSAHTGRQVGFGTLEELFEFLRMQADMPSTASRGQSGKKTMGSSRSGEEDLKNAHPEERIL
jgi:hypothetical protein